MAGGALSLASFQEPGVLDRYPQLSYDECMRELKLVHEDGSVDGGVDAVAAALALRARWRWLAALLLAPGLYRLARVGYRLVARSRYGFLGARCPDGTCAWHGAVDEGAAAREGDYRITARLFLALLGLVYLVAFGSLAVQARVLIGADGLLPVREFLAAHREDGPSRFIRLPMLFWLWDGEAAVVGGALLGLVLAAGVVLGRWRRPCLVGSWLLFLSYVTAGRDFFWFQWDNLLLESTALAFLLPARAGAAPHPWVIFLFRWLLFRLLFESGLAKVQGGAQSWFPLMAMAHYYETAPLPSLGGWYAHQLPLWAHRWTAALTLVGELLGPLLIWGPRSAWRLCFVLVAGFQVLIGGTANYGYFNLLSLALAVFLLDARDLAWLPAWAGGGGPAAGDAPGRAGWVVPMIGGAIFMLTLLDLMVLLAGQGVAASSTLVSIREWTQPFRVASKYHLFAHIDPRRVEAEIEWSVDGQAWRAYELHYKPGPLDRPPPFVAPHQPRVDFQLWFFTLGRDGGAHEYFNTLVQRLCTRPESVRGLFREASFPPRPPLLIRVGYHRYRMTDRATQASTGAYWSRQLLDYHPSAYFCDSAEKPRF
jgi:hypothetical protein